MNRFRSHVPLFIHIQNFNIVHLNILFINYWQQCLFIGVFLNAADLYWMENWIVYYFAVFVNMDFCCVGDEIMTYFVNASWMKPINTRYFHHIILSFLFILPAHHKFRNQAKSITIKRENFTYANILFSWICVSVPYFDWFVSTNVE